MKKAKAVFLLVLLLSGCSRTLSTEKDREYPTKPITYLIPAEPGAQFDRRARQQQPELERILKQKILIDYKVGGSGAIGYSELARSTPDGYSLGSIGIASIIVQPLVQRTGYQTDQLVPVALTDSTPLGLAVLKTSRYHTLQELLDAAKAKPGGITLGVAAFFGGPHMAALWLEKLTGAKFNYVPFPGGAAQQITAYLGGQVEAIMGNSDDLVRYKDQTRLLAIAHTERLSAFPDTPTFKEAGIDMVIGNDRGVAVPRGTPDQVIRTLEAAFLEIAKDPVVQAEMRTEGFVPMPMSSEESRAYIAKMTAVYKDLVKLVNK